MRNFRLAPENVDPGARASAARASRFAGATVHAVRNAEDPVASGETQSADDGTFALGGLDSRALLPARLEVRLAARDAEVGGHRARQGLGFKLTRTGVIEGRVVDADGEGQANATVVALLVGGVGATASPIIWGSTATASSRRTGSRPAPTTSGRGRARCWCIRREKIEISRPGPGRARSSCASPTRARAFADASSPAPARRSSPTRAPCCSGARRWRCRARRSARSTATASSSSGTLLPGRYEISVRVGPRVLQITERPARGRDPDRAGRHRRSRRTPSSSARRPRSEEPLSHRTPLRGARVYRSARDSVQNAHAAQAVGEHVVALVLERGEADRHAGDRAGSCRPGCS